MSALAKAGACFLAVLCVATVPPAAAQSAVGVLPVYDGGGAEWGPLFVQYMTVNLYRELAADRAFAPVLLNPGGVYTPLDTSWLVDYTADRDDVGTLLVTTLKPVVDREHGKLTLLVDVALVDKKTGDQRDGWTVSTEIKGKNTDIANSFIETNAFKVLIDPFSTHHRTFDDSPMGKAGIHMSEQIHDGLVQRLHATSVAAPVAAATGASCPMKVRITYSYKHAASQAYSMFVNGLEESISTDGGVASFSAPEGPMLVQFTVSDPPYKLAKQPIYQLSTVHSCGKSMYVVDLAKSGDAHDHWE
jgi:hypothetical protein